MVVCFFFFSNNFYYEKKKKRKVWELKHNTKKSEYESTGVRSNKYPKCNLINKKRKKKQKPDLEVVETLKKRLKIIIF